MSDIDLTLFCADPKTDIRDYLYQPISIGDVTIATNGHIAVIVPRLDHAPDAVEEVRAKLCTGVLDFVWGDYPPLAHVELPPPPLSKRVDCSSCNGSGKEHDCPNCTCDCEDCGGEGWFKSTPKQSICVSGAIFDVKYIRLIQTLPGVRAPAEHQGLGQFPFTFDGGKGCVMPCSIPLQEHIGPLPVGRENIIFRRSR